MRVWMVLFAALLLVLALPLRAESNAEEDAAKKAREAHAAGDAAALAALANAPQPDAWVVVEMLLIAGDVDVAKAVAAQRRFMDRKALETYITWRSQNPVPKEVTAAIDIGRTADDLEAFVKRADALLKSGRGVSHVWLGEMRTNALARAKRSVGDIGKAMLASAAAAEEIGWHQRAFISYRAAFQRLYAAGAANEMKRASEALLRLAEGSKNQGEAFVAHQMEAFRLQAGGNVEPALEHAETSLSHAQNTLQTRNALRVVIMMHIRLGNSHVVYRKSRRLNELDHELGDQRGIVISSTQLARYEAKLGRLAQAMARIEQVLAYTEEHGGAHADVHAAHLHAAQLNRDLGDPKRALEHLKLARDAMARSREAGEPVNYDPFTLDKTEALALALLERYEEAAALNRRVVEGRQRVPPAMRMNDLLSLAIDLAYLGKHDEAAEYFDKAEAFLDPKLEAHQHVRFYGVKASGLVLAGKMDEAYQVASKGTQVGREERFNESHRFCLGAIGRVWFERGNMKKSVEAFDEMLGLLLERSAMLPDRAGATFRTQQATRAKHVSEYYGIEAAARTGDPAVLFRMSERLGSVALRSRLGTMDVADSLPPELREKELELQEAETQAVQRLRTVRGNERAAAMRALNAVRKELDRHRERMRAEQVAAAQVIDPAIDDFKTAQQRLAADEALVLYAEGAEHFWALVADRKRARIVKLAPLEDVETAVEMLVLEDAGGEPKDAVVRLQALIVRPLALDKGVKRLAVVPTGSLAFVPYAALLSGRAVTLLPSVTTARLIGAQKAAGKDTLAVGDPESGDGRRLPGSSNEARAIGDVVLLGSAATEAGIEETLAKRERWRAVHIACHGLIDPFHPLRSALSLTPDEDDDGLWTVSEVLSTRVPTDLAVLGACSTGRGKSFNQEGVLGFVHAFFVAGARQVIVSLWDVDDEATSELLQRFHEEWKPGVTAAAALRRAQDAVRKQPKWQHPAHWAAWQIWGPR